jgi:hypothetical protein
MVSYVYTELMLILEFFSQFKSVSRISCFHNHYYKNSPIFSCFKSNAVSSNRGKFSNGEKIKTLNSLDTVSVGLRISRPDVKLAWFTYLLIVQRRQLKTSECHSKRGGGNGLTNHNPPLALPTPSHIPLTWHSRTEVVTSVH